MSTIKSLWKVVITNKIGAQAPAYLVETEYDVVKGKSNSENKELEELKALEEAKTMTRLSDFPNIWKIEVFKMNCHWDTKRQKWWTNEIV